MILSKLENYLRMHPGASQTEMAKHFSLTEDGIDAMMAVWSRKGKVKVVCSRAGKSTYHWLNDTEIAIRICH
ncbi:FeoC-like transcriptional regulator [Veronia pacifica]|uniref:Transcriptional regulator HTH-type FeoC domain-containing protein n=1 Tax=Veronia pacifica TaxID=1080227 RepID=A0A1C3ERJ1_9GAMM|nr:FeoC-like transcriptional regulator [Veronia pacifica]ODA35841.1 hypothetical protein A8L45_02050 [Veronia pacifica]